MKGQSHDGNLDVQDAQLMNLIRVGFNLTCVSIEAMNLYPMLAICGTPHLSDIGPFSPVKTTSIAKRSTRTFLEPARDLSCTYAEQSQ